ncbi:hypothetical protein ACSE3M_05955 [Bacillus velezensis]
MKRAGGYEGNIDDLIIGCATPEAEQGLNMARNIGALAGLPHTVLSHYGEPLLLFRAPIHRLRC